MKSNAHRYAPKCNGAECHTKLISYDARLHGFCTPCLRRIVTRGFLTQPEVSAAYLACERLLERIVEWIQWSKIIGAPKIAGLYATTSTHFARRIVAFESGTPFAYK